MKIITKNKTLSRTIFLLLLMLLLSINSSLYAQSNSTNDVVRSKVTQSGQKIVERANALYNQKKYLKAILMYRKAEKRGVDPVVTSFNTGNCYFQLEKLPQAAAAFKKAIRLSNKEYTPALFNLAAVLYRLQQYSESIAVYHRALRTKPDNTSAWLYLAEAYQRTGDLVGTQKALEEAILLNPDDISISYQLAEVHVSMDEYDQAINLIRAAYVSNPDETDFLIYIGDLYRLHDDLTNAAGSYREALSLQNDNIDLMYKLADVLSLDEKPFLAMDYLNKALLLKPDFLDAIIFIGNLYYDSQWWDRAEETYLQAMNLGSSEGLQGIKNIAWEFERMGDKKGALVLFNRLLKAGFGNMEIRQEIQRLNEN